MHESELPMQVGLMSSCEPTGRFQMHSTGWFHWQSAGNHNISRIFKASYWKCMDYCDIYHNFQII